MDSLSWQREDLCSESMGETGDDVSSPSPRTSVKDLLPRVDLSGQQFNHRFLSCMMGPPSQQAGLVQYLSVQQGITNDFLKRAWGSGAESKEEQRAHWPSSGNKQN